MIGNFAYSEPTPPADRLEHDKLVKSEFAAAQKLLGQGQFKEALAKFKWVYANNQDVQVFPSGREIRRLTRHYPPALAAVRRWRRDKERLILAGEADGQVIGDWHSLNSVLKEPNRTLKILAKLDKDETNEEIVESVLWHVWEDLAKARRYEDLRSFLPTIGWVVLQGVGDFDAEVLFPRTERTKREQEKELLRMRTEIVSQGTLVYEVALALGELAVARALFKKVATTGLSDSICLSFIRSAKRVKAREEALFVFNEASSLISPKKLKQSSKAVTTKGRKV